MVTLTVGKRCDFEDIEVGEVFAFDGCTSILYKDSEKSAIFLATDAEDEWESVVFRGNQEYNDNILGRRVKQTNGKTAFVTNNRLICWALSGINDRTKLCFKLPKSVQKLWGEFE